MRATAVRLAGVVEIRSYHCKPEGITSFVKKVTSSSDLRKSLLPLRLFTVPEVGGKLNIANHMYFYPGGLTERASTRKNSGADKSWIAAVNDSRVDVDVQFSTIYTELDDVLKAASCQGFKDLSSGSAEAKDGEKTFPTLYEYRRYKLQLGYDTVPRFSDLFCSGIVGKVTSVAPSTSLVTVLSSEVGSINEVIEIWRHGDGVRGMQLSRENCRKVQSWKDAVNGIAKLAIEFDTSLHVPLSFSPWK